MDLLVEYTKTYEKDLKGFSELNRERIETKIEEVCQSFLDNPSDIYNHASLPFKIKSYKAFNSSLSAIPVGQKIRILVTIDQDPIFDQLIVTLIKVVKTSHLHQAFKSIAESLYQDNLILLEKDEQNDTKE